MIDKIFCNYCGKYFSKYGIKNHIAIAHFGHIERVSHKGKRSVPAWNKGLTKETDSRVKEMAIKTSLSTTGKIGIPHTEETKKKLSNIRKEYLLKNPDKVPYKLNHSRDESYPEKYFTELFQSENIIVKKWFRIGLYELDFSIPERKIDIEIDGDQHYLDDKIKEIDRRRDEYLKTNGWDIIRIKWSDYKRLTKEERKIYIKDLKKYLLEIIENKPLIDPNLPRKKEKILKKKIRNKKRYYCTECGIECSYRNDKCRDCAMFLMRKIKERPSLETILKDIENMGFLATGRKYGVSDNSIRKWIKYYNNFSK